MGDCFKPLRRRICLLTLLMACVFAAGWVRSVHGVDDVIIHANRHLRVNMSSILQSLAVSVVYSDQPEIYDSFFWWNSILPYVDKAPRIEQSRNLCYAVQAPYWLFVIPLTLLSSYLLPSRPRKSTSEKITEPVPESLV